MVVTSKEIFMAKKERSGIPIISSVILGHSTPDVHTQYWFENAKFMKPTFG